MGSLFQRGVLNGLVKEDVLVDILHYKRFPRTVGFSDGQNLSLTHLQGEYIPTGTLASDARSTL